MALRGVSILCARRSLVRFPLPPVWFRLARARFQLRPVSREPSGISLRLGGVSGCLSAARALVATMSEPLMTIRV